MRCCPERGQTLVELALAMPAFCFAVWMLVQLSFFCLNLVNHQRMAQIASDRSALSGYRRTGFYRWIYGAYGPTPRWPFGARMNMALIPVPEQKQFRGVFGAQTVDAPGYLVAFEVTSTLRPGDFMGRWLRSATQRAVAETWWEPAVPEQED